jgi:hypothetical protein
MIPIVLVIILNSLGCFELTCNALALQSNSGQPLGDILPARAHYAGQIIAGLAASSSDNDNNNKELSVNGSVEEPPASELLEIERQTRSFQQQLERTKPQDVKAELGTNDVYISWKPPLVKHINSQPIVEYKIFRWEANNPYASKLLGKTTGLSFNDTSAVKGKSYIYNVVSTTKNQSGGSAQTTPLLIQ